MGPLPLPTGVSERGKRPPTLPAASDQIKPCRQRCSLSEAVNFETGKTVTLYIGRKITGSKTGIPERGPPFPKMKFGKEGPAANAIRSYPKPSPPPPIGPQGQSGQEQEAERRGFRDGDQGNLSGSAVIDQVSLRRSSPGCPGQCAGVRGENMGSSGQRQAARGGGKCESRARQIEIAGDCQDVDFLTRGPRNRCP
jgi:hypothetical protein